MIVDENDVLLRKTLTFFSATKKVCGYYVSGSVDNDFVILPFLGIPPKSSTCIERSREEACRALR
jgi:hypothetical protein